MVYSLGQDISPGHEAIEERYSVEKKEGAVGDFGAGSPLWTRKRCLVSDV